MDYWESRIEDDSDLRKMKEPLLCASSFCSAFSELSQPGSVFTGSWHLTWEANLFIIGLFKV